MPLEADGSTPTSVPPVPDLRRSEMAKAKRDEPNEALTASQVVAHNVTRARELRGLTQAEVGERLSRFTGTRWSQVTVAQAEGWASGQRVRQFGADELVALARTFDLPALYFLLPPEDGRRGLATPDSPAEGWPWEYLLMLVWGHRGNFPFVAERAAPWAHASTILTAPGDDVLDGEPDVHRFARDARAREPFTPEDMLAMAFNGLARQQPGGLAPGEETEKLATNLEWLARMLRAFDAGRPGTYFDADTLRKMAEEPGEGDESA